MWPVAEAAIDRGSGGGDGPSRRRLGRQPERAEQAPHGLRLGQRIEEIVTHPQLEHRDVLQTVSSKFGPMKLVGSGFRLAHGSPGLDRPPPTLGEHTAEVLGEASYGPAEIERLRESGVV